MLRIYLQMEELFSQYIPKERHFPQGVDILRTFAPKGAVTILKIFPQRNEYFKNISPKGRGNYLKNFFFKGAIILIRFLSRGENFLQYFPQGGYYVQNISPKGMFFKNIPPKGGFVS